MIELVHTRAELAAARRARAGVSAVVMTMGALHEGHEALIRAARSQADHVLITIFVNPLQFGPNEDFDRYPRTLDADLAAAERAGADTVFAPAMEEMYPNGQPMVRVNPGPLGELWEGASRPGFFHGVLTVVLKLLHLTQPDLAFFGEKDYQQLTLIRRMVHDLDLPVEIVGVPTEREPDGLARSSRNRYLSPAQRRVALALSAALAAGAGAAQAGSAQASSAQAGAARGGAGAAGVLAAAAEAFDKAAAVEPDVPVELDYLVLTDPDLGPPPSAGPARMLVAARVGGTRLIDNLALEMSS